MYLTRFELDLNKRRTLLALASPNLFHGALESSFSGVRQSPLWRIDKLQGKTYILLLSRDIPALDSAVEQFGTADGWITKDYSPLLCSIQAGEQLRFRLVANPTSTRAQDRNDDGEKPRGIVFAHTTPEHQSRWLIQTAQRCGFSLGESDFQVVESRWHSFRKDAGRRVTFLSASFEGVLCVTDQELFCSTLINGIGREKAYGMGLLTVLRARKFNG